MFFNDNFPINFPENSSWKLPKKPPVFIEAAAELETTAATMRLSDSMSKSTEARSGGMFGSTTGDQLGGLEHVLPSGKHTKNYGKYWKITLFNGKIPYNGHFQ